MKNLLINFLKIGVSLAIIVYLVVDVQRNNQGMFQRLVDEPKQWWMLLLAWALIFGAVVLSFVRWFLLVRALDLPFRLRDAFRLGFLGYLLNFVSLGSVGGDLFKAVFIAREQPGRRTAAVTTVVVDRFVGLVGLALLACLAVLSTDFSQFGPEIQMLGRVTLIATAISISLFICMLFRFGTEGPLANFLSDLPRVGEFFQRVLEAARTYRERRSVLFQALGISLLLQVMNVTGFYCIARGLPDAAPSLAVHFLIIPLGMISGALPLPMGALGAFEAIMKYLYAHVPPYPDSAAAAARGLLVALAYRLITILVALVGVGFYLSSRREVDAALHEAEELEETTHGVPHGSGPALAEGMRTVG